MWGSEGKNGGAYAKACAPTIAAAYFEIDMNVIGYHRRTFLIHNCRNKGLDPIIDNNCLETSATAFAPHFKSFEYTAFRIHLIYSSRFLLVLWSSQVIFRYSYTLHSVVLIL
jgi:hypothetical protein